MHRVLFLIVGLVFSGFGGLLLWRSLKAQAAHDWPTVVGIVVGHETERFKSRRSAARYEPRVEYEYRVEGATYRSSRMQFTGRTGLPRSMSQQDAMEAALAQWPMGSEIAVRYNPESPGESALRASDPEWWFTGVVGGTGLVVLGVCAGQMVLALRRRRASA